MQRIASLTAMILTLAVSARAEVFPQVKNPDTFIYVTISDIDTLDPAYAYDTGSHLIQYQIYESLIGYKGWSLTEFEPRLATKVPSVANGLVSTDGKTYTFPIRQGVKFHDGTPMTCQDARYSILRFMISDRSGGPSAILLEPIAGVQSTRDDQGRVTLDFAAAAARVTCQGENLKITLPKPYGPFLGIVAQWTQIVSQTWAAAHGDWDGTAATWEAFNNPKKESSPFFEGANGTGPFALERWDKRTKTNILKRHDAYWRAPARLARVIVRGVSEFSTRKLLLEKGDADYIEVSRQFEPQVTGVPGVVVSNHASAWTTSINLNFKIRTAGNPYIGSGRLDGNGIPSDFFADPDVRAGFVLCYDQKRHTQEILRGQAEPTRGVIPPGFLGYNPKQPVPTLDLTTAEAHFRKAFGGQLWEKGFRMIFAFNEGNDTRQALANMIKKNIESLNPKFQIDIRPMLWSTFVSDQSAEKLPLTIIGWVADFPDPHNFAFTYWHSEGAYASRNHYKNPKVDELVTRALFETDPQKRKALYYELTKIGFADNAYIYGVTAKDVIVHRDWVKGYRANPLDPKTHYFYPMYKSLDKTSAPASGAGK
ncbi:MAG: ABC transporter substrate-binding protein [Elusimicrobiota bacterium]